MDDRKLRDHAEQTVESKVVYRGGLLHVLQDEARQPDGRLVRREYIRHPGAATMVPLIEPDVVVLVHQYRYAPRRHFFELPAGKIDAGEDGLQAAQRELREECGYQARDWRHLATLHPCIGYSDERIELFLARQLTHIGAAPDDGELLDVITIPLAEALDWVRSGRITDVKTIIGLMWADRFRPE